jgi:hypothetical protein
MWLLLCLTWLSSAEVRVELEGAQWRAMGLKARIDKQQANVVIVS